MTDGTQVHSQGFADDTLVLAPSWEDALIQHDWVREFFIAHHFRFNSEKSYCISALGVTAGRCLPGIGPLMCLLLAQRLHLHSSQSPGSRFLVVPPRHNFDTLATRSVLTSPRTGQLVWSQARGSQAGFGIRVLSSASTSLISVPPLISSRSSSTPGLSYGLPSLR